MLFIEFYTPAAVTPKKLIPATGDRSVIVLDARQRATTHHTIAMDEQDKRGFAAYRLMRGRALHDARPATEVYMSPALSADGWSVDT